MNGFNQTGNGTFCLKETGKAALAAGLAKANLSAEALAGMQGSLQIIQIASTGASLYNVRVAPTGVDVYLDLADNPLRSAQISLSTPQPHYLQTISARTGLGLGVWQSRMSAPGRRRKARRVRRPLMRARRWLLELGDLPLSWLRVRSRCYRVVRVGSRIETWHEADREEQRGMGWIYQHMILCVYFHEI